MKNPVIRNITAQVIENYIFKGFFSTVNAFTKISDGNYMVNRQEVREWIESHPVDMWEIEEKHTYSTTYSFTPELEILFVLRWSK